MKFKPKPIHALLTFIMLAIGLVHHPALGQQFDMKSTLQGKFNVKISCGRELEHCAFLREMYERDNSCDETEIQ